MGWGGAVLKTITPDDLKMIETSPRYTTIKEKGKVICLQNIELLSHESIQYWVDGIKYLKAKHPSKVIIASLMAPVERKEWQNIVKTLNTTPSKLKNIAVSKIISHEKLNKKSHLFPSIDKEKCVSCRKCVEICTESESHALNLEKKCINVNKELCVGCSLCSHIRPKEAIKMIY